MPLCLLNLSFRSHLGECTPRLRFPGFEGAWSAEYFDDVATGFEYGLNAAAVDFDGVHKYIRITDIDDTSHKFIGSPVVSPAGEIDEKYRVRPNDILLARTGASTGKSYLYDSSDGELYFAGFLIRASVKPEYDARFVFYSTCTPPYRRWVNMISMRSGQPGINADEYSRYNLNIPTHSEQVQIGTFLALLDSKITAQHKFVELLKKHKRGLVQDLFTSELSKLPRLRFAGFKDAWTIRSFDEVFSFLKNNTLPRSEMTTAGGMIRNVHYGDVLIKYGDVLDCNRDQIPFLVSDKQSDDYRLLEDGDVVIADTAEDEAVGKTVELVGVANKLIESGLHTIACRPTISFAPRFLGYYLNSTAYRRQLLPLMQGIKVLSLSKSQLGKTQLLFPPDINEQKRIAELLTGIDAHIAMAQSHLDKMQSLKTGFLQQLFV